MLIKFSQIIPPKADDPTDSRRTNKRAGLKELKASIMEHGLLQGLLVQQAGKKYALVDGRRRWHAMKELIDEKKLPPASQWEVSCTQTTLEGPLEASLAANIVREPLHPVDEYEDFRILIEDGAKPADLAKRFGLSKRHVEQRLALGRLHPDVREAWRSGLVDADVAKALTLGSLERQKEILTALVEGGYLEHDPVVIRHRILGYYNEDDAVTSLKFVGRAAYEKAGGAIAADLFGDYDFPLDLKLLRKLADEKLLKACEEAEADGCPFALVDRDIPPSDRALYSDAPQNSTKAGVIIGIGTDGKPTTRRVIRATVAERPAKPERKTKAAKGDGGGISPSVTGRLEEIVDAAVRDCITDDPDLAETILCAGLLSPPSGAFDPSHRDFSAAPGKTFAENLEAVAELDVRPREELFTGCIAQCIRLSVDREAAKAVLALIPDEFDKAYRARLAKEEALFGALGRRDAISIIRTLNPKGGDPGALSDTDLKLEAKKLICERAWMPPSLDLGGQS